MEEKESKIEQFIKKREELKKSPVPNKSSNASVFKDENPKIKSLKNQPKTSKTIIKSATPKIETKDVVKLTPDRFKAVQARLKANSSIKSKMAQAIKKGDESAMRGIVSKVGEVAKKTGDTDLLSDLVKKVSKSKFAKKGIKKVGKKLLSAIPFVGGIASALSSGDIKAAVPGLDLIDNVGPKKGSLNQRIESGDLTPEELEELKRTNYTGKK